MSTPSQPVMIGGDTTRAGEACTGPGTPTVTATTSLGARSASASSCGSSSRTSARFTSGPGRDVDLAPLEHERCWPPGRRSAKPAPLAPKSATTTTPLASLKANDAARRPPVLCPLPLSASRPASSSRSRRSLTVARARPLSRVSVTRVSAVPVRTSSRSRPAPAVLRRLPAVAAMRQTVPVLQDVGKLHLTLNISVSRVRRSWAGAWKRGEVHVMRRTRRPYRAIALAVGASLSLTVAACGDERRRRQAPPAGGAQTVGVMIKGLDNPFFAAMNDGVEAAAARYRRQGPGPGGREPDRHVGPGLQARGADRPGHVLLRRQPDQPDQPGPAARAGSRRHAGGQHRQPGR